MKPFVVIWSAHRIILAAAVIAGAGAYVLSNQQPEVYEADALVQVTTSQQAQGTFMSDGSLLQLTNVYVQLAQSDGTFNRARSIGGLPEDNTALRAHTSVSADQAGVLRFIARASDPARSVKYVNSFANGFAKLVGDAENQQRQSRVTLAQARIDVLERQLNALTANSRKIAALQAAIQTLQAQVANILTTPTDSARVIQPARPPSAPASPKPLRNAMLGVLAALLLLPTVVYMLFLYRGRYGTAEAAGRDLALPVLGEIVHGAPGDLAVVEALRALRVSLEFVSESRMTDPELDRGEIFLITSPNPGAGKTFVSANVARTFAVDGRDVVALDGDLRRPALHERLELPLGPGLHDVLREELDLEEVMRSVDVAANGHRDGRLDVLTAGKSTPEAAELLSSRIMGATLEHLRRAGPLLLVDSPPVLGVSDPLILSRYATGVILVINARRTRRREAQQAVESLRAVGAPLIGLVFNDLSRAGTERYYGAYYTAVAASD